MYRQLADVKHDPRPPQLTLLLLMTSEVLQIIPNSPFFQRKEEATLTALMVVAATSVAGLTHPLACTIRKVSITDSIETHTHKISVCFRHYSIG